MAAGGGWGCNQACLGEDRGHSAPWPPIFCPHATGQGINCGRAYFVHHILNNNGHCYPPWEGCSVHGDRTGTCEWVPILLPPLIAFAWKKCLVVDNKTKLGARYADNPLDYGKLWDPTAQDGTRAELHIPWMIALPLWAARLYHQFKGAVMPHKLLAAMERHLASPDTSLDNGDDWGLVQKMAAGSSPEGRWQWGAYQEEVVHCILDGCTPVQ
jgi:hypothetical protein